mgnify:CR=1 FL=1
MAQEALRVGFFMDGYTLRKVNEYYKVHHKFHSNLDFRGLKHWVQMHVVRTFGDEAKRLEMECHYYHPSRNPRIYGSEVEGVLRLEHELSAVGFQVHYSSRPDEPDMPGPNLGLMEDALLIASYHRVDVIVLFSTQGQYAPLPDRLRMMGIPTILLGWDFMYPKGKRMVRWRTDTCLRETCAQYVAMEKVVDLASEEDRVPRGFFFQKDKPFSRGRNAVWSSTPGKALA